MNVENGSLNFTATVEYKQLVDAVKDIEKRLGSIEASASKAGDSLDKLGGGFKDLLGAIGGTAAITGFVKQMFNVRKSFQDTQSAMEVFLGSSEKAEEHLKELQKYAWYNMFDFETLTQASAQLQAFGTDVGDVIPLVDRLSNIAAGTKTDLMELVSSFNRAKSVGTADSRLLMSFATKGLDVVNTLREMGVAVDSTSVSFEQLMMAVEAATNEGGRFYNLMDAQFDNLSSLAGAVEDDISIMLNEIGEKLQPTMESALKFTHELIDNYETVGRVLVALLATYGTYRTALIAATVVANLQAAGVAKLTAAEKIHYAWLVITEKAQKLLNKTMLSNPYVLLATVIVGATAAIIAHTKAANSAEVIEKRLNGELEKRLELHNQLVEESGEYINALYKEKTSAEELNNAYEALRKIKPFENMSNAEIKSLGAEKIREMIDDFDASEQVEIAEEKMRNRIEEYNKTISSAIGNASTGSVLGKAKSRSLYRSADTQLSTILDENAKMVGVQIAAFDNLDRKQKEIKFTEAISSLESLNSSLDESDVRFKMNIQAIELYKAELAGLALSDNSVKLPIFGDNDKNSLVSKIKDSEKALNDLRSKMLSLNSYDAATADKDIKAAQESLDALKNQYKTITGNDYDKVNENNLKAQRDAIAAQMELIDDQYEQKRKKTEAQFDNEIADLKRRLETEANLTTEQRTAINSQIVALQKQKNKAIEDIDNAELANKRKREQEKTKLDADDARRAAEYENEKIQAEIDAMDDGFQKELAQMELNHRKRLDEIEKEKNEEAKAYEDTAKKRYLNSNPNADEGDFYAQWKGIPQDAQNAIDERANARTDSENNSFFRSKEQLIEKLLSQYEDYTSKKLAIDEKYNKEAADLDAAYAEAKSDEERKSIENARNASKRSKAMDTLEVEIANINTTQYDDVKDKVEAINTAYRTYIESLREAGATEKELADAQAQWYEATDEFVMLQERQAELIAQIDYARQFDPDKVKGLENELKGVNSEISKMTKANPGRAFIEGFEQNKMQMILDVTQQLVAAFQQLAEASDGMNAKDASGFMSSVSKGLQGFAQGGFIGLLMAGIEDTISQITDAITSAKKLETALKEANLDAWTAAMQEMMDSGGGIFGDDAVANVNAAVAVLDEAKMKMVELGNTTQDLSYRFSDYLAMTNLFNWKTALTLTTGADYTNAAFKTWQDALDKGYSQIESYVLMKNDRGWLVNFFGIDDQFTTLKDAAAELGYDLYDQYGNLNSDALQAILDTYEDLTGEQRQWLEQGIAYSKQYAEAMESIASYLEDLFGGVSSTIADSMVDAFIESGDAAIDLGEVVSDVGKQMAKDLLNSLIMSTYFDELEPLFKQRIAKEGMNADTAAWMMTQIQGAMAALDGDMAYWNQMLEGWSSMWGDAADDASSVSGSGLSGASQESIDLMNGQLNAMRAVQLRIDSNIGDILLRLSGIDTHMIDGFSKSHEKLDQIADNTSYSGSMVRGLGAYFN